ncbi:Putative exonuclease SbcCD, C subunit [Desulfotomaculum arcticum]|uniref:Putative exonuclease SbcCD, C subunit n=1 Tax=Desulfotruncus arcticus DSM 17038 TaxID=1121424 RepID=A0A1I2PGN6_9FIRM|nr:Putative exonuclease SbcCD, C subunit [Desulfotomaculum arcticum] [Desulfotruncus arcticus DSM 17038]
MAILASFYRVYHLYRKKDILRLVVFDEALNRMDADNVEECMRFIQILSFQVQIVDPAGKTKLVVPFVNTNIIVMREGSNSFVEHVTCKEIEQWVEHEQHRALTASR